MSDNQWQRYLQDYHDKNQLNASLKVLSIAELEQQDIIVDLADRAMLQISGRDSSSFLQGQLTCNLEEVTQTASRRAAHCNPKGRILLSARCLQWQDSIYLLLPRCNLEPSLNDLKRYAVFYQLELTAMTNEIVCIGINIADPISQFARRVIDLAEDETIQQGQYIIINEIPRQRYLIIGNTSAIIELHQQYFTEFKLGSTDHWRLLNIDSGRAEIVARNRGLFTPHELNYQLSNTISFNKGCYTGQEIIARMQHRGQLKKALWHAVITPQQAEISALQLSNLVGQAVGQVVMAANDNIATHALVCAQNSACQNGDFKLDKTISVAWQQLLPTAQ